MNVDKIHFVVLIRSAKLDPAEVSAQPNGARAAGRLGEVGRRHKSADRLFNQLCETDRCAILEIRAN